MLWQVIGTQLQILGTIHVSDRPLALHEKMVEAMRAAKTFVFEGSLDRTLDTPLRFYETDDLSAHVPGSLFAETRKLWSELGLDDDELMKARPWWAGLRIQMTTYHQRGYLAKYGVDRTVFDFAKQNGKRMFFLESPNDGLAPLGQASDHEQGIYLENCVREVEENVHRLRTMIEAWQALQPESVRSAVEQVIQLVPMMFEEAIAGRNRKWLPKLLHFARSGRPALAALGTLHLVGKNSVLELLKDSGLECVRIVD